jgi:hypothetical protein
MKKLLCYICIIWALLSLISEFALKFPKLKLIYYSFNTEKYFEEDELIIQDKTKSSISKGVGGKYIYIGKLRKNKTDNKITGYPNSMEEKILSDSTDIYFKVWYCKNLNYIMLKNEDNLPLYKFWKAWLQYIIIGFAIPCTIYIVKNRKSENLFISDIRNIIKRMK